MAQHFILARPRPKEFMQRGKSGRALPHSKTQARSKRSNDGHVLEGGGIPAALGSTLPRGSWPLLPRHTRKTQQAESLTRKPKSRELPSFLIAKT
jgi:hypothetical protein